MPISGWHGDNMMEPSTKMSLCRGWKITRKEVNMVAMKLLEASCPLPALWTSPCGHLYRTYTRWKASALVPMDRVETGFLKPGMVVTFAPYNMATEVKSVKMHHEVAEALPSDNVGFKVKTVSVKDIRWGYVAGDSKNDLPLDVGNFISQVIILNHPGSIAATHPFWTAARQTSGRRLALRQEAGRQPKAPKSGDSAIIQIIP